MRKQSELHRIQPTAFIPGTPGDDSLTGTSGADTIDGGAGADSMSGGEGHDTYIVDNAGDVVVEAGDGGGLDLVLASVGFTLGRYVENLTLTGVADIDGTGNGWDNRIVGNSGANELMGRYGDDTLIGAEGNDQLHAGAGTDDLRGGAGNDTLYGGEVLGSSADALYGGAGSDLLQGMAEGVYLYGGDGNDTLRGRSEFHWDHDYDYLHGGNGDDELYAGAGFGVLDGGDGSDTLVGGYERDELHGGNGDDHVAGQKGEDDLYDGMDDGADTLLGGAGYDRLIADWSGATEDIVWTNTDDDQRHVVFGNTVAGIEALRLKTGAGNDAITNEPSGYTQIDSGAGHDTLIADNGGFDAGSGNDLVLATMSAHSMLTGGVGDDTLRAISVSFGWGDELHGGDGNDVLVTEGASKAADTLSGGIGFDTLRSGIGADTLDGGLDTDGDSFIFGNLVGADEVHNYSSGSDYFIVDESGVVIGDGDAVVDGAVVIAGPGGHGALAELVIATNDIAGNLTAAKAAAAIGSASSAYTAGRTAIFVVDNGVDTAVYHFESAGADAAVTADELTLLATLSGTGSTVLADYAFVP